MSEYVKKRGRFALIGARAKRQKYLLVMLALAVIYVGIFSYGPMWGMLIAFVNYKPASGLLGSEFMGLHYFRQFLTNPDFPMLMRNTIAISALNIVCGIVFPVLFALLLNELVGMKFKRVVQTISYLPHFISYVVVANIALTVFSPTGGVINQALMALGIIEKPIFFFAQPKGFWFLIAGINVWKEMGWAAIIYITSISAIDPQLYEAAMVDGAGRFKRVIHITLPGILSTIVVLTILAIPELLNAGFEPSFLLGNPLVSDYSQVIDTYVYSIGLQQGRFSLATAVGLMRMGVGLILILSANAFAHKVSDYSLF